MKKLIDSCEQQKDTARQFVKSTRNQLQRIVNAFSALDVGPFDQDVLGVRSTNQRPATTGCSTCSRSIRSYSSLYTYLQERLVDNALDGNVPAIGNLVLNREALKPLIQMPRGEKVDALAQELKYWESNLNRSPQGLDPREFLQVEGDEVVVMDEELNAFCQTLEVYATGENASLLEDLENLVVLVNRVNALLPKRGLKPIAAPVQYDDQSIFLEQRTEDGKTEIILNTPALVPRLRN